MTAEDRDIVELVEFFVDRMQHLLRLAAVSDPRTMAGYLLAVHLDVRARFDALRPILEAEPAPDPLTLAN